MKPGDRRDDPGQFPLSPHFVWARLAPVWTEEGTHKGRPYRRQWVMA